MKTKKNLISFFTLLVVVATLALTACASGNVKRFSYNVISVAGERNGTGYIEVKDDGNDAYINFVHASGKLAVCDRGDLKAVKSETIKSFVYTVMPKMDGCNKQVFYVKKDGSELLVDVFTSDVFIRQVKFKPVH